MFVAPRKIQFISSPQRKDYQPCYVSDSIMYEMSDVEKEICEKVEHTHPQSFPLIDFLLVMLHARTPGVIQFGVKGIGKSASQNCIAESVKGVEFIRADPGFTPAYVGNPDTGMLEILTTRPVTLLIDDLTSFFSSTTTLVSFQFISQLQYAKSWFGRVKGQPVIEKTDLNVFAAGTYWCGAQAVSLGIWDSHVVDRFIRLYPIYYHHPLDINGYVYSNPVPARFKFDYVPVPFRKLGWSVSAEYERKCVEMLKTQFTERRAVMYMRDILESHAWVCGREYVTDDDAKWLLLYYPWIAIESVFTYKKILPDRFQSSGLIYSDVPAEILFWVGFREMRREDLYMITRYRFEVIDTVLRKLREIGLVDEECGYWSLAGKLKESIETLYRSLGGEMYVEMAQ